MTKGTNIENIESDLIGNLDRDFNILIRSILKENNNLFVRAGGGIVADSIPENETFETEAKANGMLKAINTFKK